VDLPDADHADACGREEVQHRLVVRRHREILAVVGPAIVSGGPHERPRDHARDAVRVQDPPRGLARPVEFLERDRLLVRGDLEDRVGRGIDDQVSGALMLLPESSDDLRAARGHVPEHAASGLAAERVEDLGWKAVREQRERTIEDDSGHLPVSGRRVLAGRGLRHAPEVRARMRFRRDARDLGDPAEAHATEIRNAETPDRTRGIRERIRAAVSVSVRVRHLPATHAVQNEPQHLANHVGLLLVDRSAERAVRRPLIIFRHASLVHESRPNDATKRPNSLVLRARRGVG